MNQRRIDALMGELSDLEHALDHTDDQAKEARLRAMVASRRAQLNDMRMRSGGGEH